MPTPATLDSYPHSDDKPPVVPSLNVDKDVSGWQWRPGTDTTRYVQKPDIDFPRPWIANPGGHAFVWPLGIEEFTLSSNAELGIHKYMGDNHVDIDVVYPDELHIILNGMFPGKTAAKVMHALRSVIMELPTNNVDGRLLSLPFVFPTIQYVAVLNSSFSHSTDQDSYSVTYNIEFVVARSRPRLLGPPVIRSRPMETPLSVTESRGKSQSIITTQTTQSLRLLANAAYDDPRQWQTLLWKNRNELDSKGIPPHLQPVTRIPIGTEMVV